jgi:hypothetical protein
MSTHDEYKKIDPPEGVRLVPCPVCRSAAELWRRSDSPSAPTETAVCCSSGEAFGPQTGEAAAGCLLFMPPDDFYRGTIREAVKYWTEYANALEAKRRARNWEIAKPLRTETAIAAATTNTKEGGK